MQNENGFSNAAVREQKSVKHSRYEILDACRGAAAILVACYHFGTLEHHGTVQYVPNGFLAVDFFFILSGFVIDRSYAAKLEQGLSVRSFLTRRLGRLYPLYILGQFLGAARQIAGIAIHEPRALSALKVGIAFFFGLIVLPSPFAGRHLFALNSPSWSIFFELAANLAFAAFAFSLRRRTIIGIVVLAYVCFCVLACSTGKFFDFGQSWTHAFGGIFRVTVGFLIGVAISRFVERPPRLTDLAYLVVIVLILVIALPRSQVSAGIGSLYSLLFVGLIAPAVVVAGSLLDVRTGRRCCAYLGGMSYPLYIVHPFLTDPTIAVVQRLHLTGLVATLMYLLISLGVASVLYYAYDIPIAGVIQRWRGSSKKLPQAEMMDASYR